MELGGGKGVGVEEGRQPEGGSVGSEIFRESMTVERENMFFRVLERRKILECGR